MRIVKFVILSVVICFLFAGCFQQPPLCQPGDNPCYKAKYMMVPDSNKASGYRYLTLGETLFGEKDIQQKNKN